MPLTDVQIRNIKPPERGQKTYPDTGGLRGLSLRVSCGGAKTFCLIPPTDRSRRRITLGRYGLGGITLSQARAEGARILAEQTLGLSKPKSLAFQDAFDLYKAHKLPQNRASTAKETQRLLEKALSRFRGQTLTDITTPDLAAFLDRTTEKAHVHTALATFFNWCVRRGYIEQNPLGRLQKERPTPRDRALGPHELRSVLLVADQHGRYGQLIKFLLYTGQRLGQAHAITEAHIDRDKMTLSWPGSEMKTGRPHSIPYGPLTGNLLNQAISSNPGPATRLFTKTERYHARLVKAAGVEWFRRHDIRRSYATCLAQWTAPHVLEKLLAHSGGQISGVAAIYNRYSYMAEMREAVNKWESFLAELML